MYTVQLRYINSFLCEYMNMDMDVGILNILKVTQGHQFNISAAGGYTSIKVVTLSDL